jgi:aspartyl-tRNA(Asn)/glutamyl-tRNA(Gln) amidotransferase subunit B
MHQYSLPEYDAELLTSSESLADYFEEVASHSGKPKAVSNWILSGMLRRVKEAKQPVDMPMQRLPVSPAALSELIRLTDEGTISGSTAKLVFEEMYRTGGSPVAIVQKNGLTQITDRSAIETTVRRVITENPNQVEQYRKGRTKTLTWLIGRVMKATGGRANPKIVREELRNILDP